MGTGGVLFRRFRAKLTDRPTGFVWVEQDRLAACGRPSSRGQLKWLASHGIDTILTLTEEPLPDEWSEGLGLDIRHVAMRDHQAPEAGALDEAVGFLVGRLADGKKVAVHCLAGEGRTGCVLAAYLAASKGVGGAEAIETVRRSKARFVERSQEAPLMQYISSRRRPDEGLDGGRNGEPAA